MLEWGAKKMLDMGCGDDSPEKGMEAGLHERRDQVLRFWKFLLKKKFLTSPQSKYPLLGVQAVSVQVLSNKKKCSETYNRDFLTLPISSSGSNRSLAYRLGDALEIFPQNDPQRVSDFLNTRTLMTSTNELLCIRNRRRYLPASLVHERLGSVGQTFDAIYAAVGTL
jgi:sulfite reductase alpha subunit-like flavoprotein